MEQDMLDASGPQPVLRVTDLKQAVYCARVPYWNYVMPVDRWTPRKVEMGAADHLLISRLEKRRKLQSYGVLKGSRRFRVRLFSPSLGLSGIIDALIETDEERIPVEYKDTLGGVRLNHRVQLMAYGLMLRELPGPPVRRGMVFVIPDERSETVPFNLELEAKTRNVLADLRRSIALEDIPEPADRWAKCRDCEFRRLCGDRWSG